MSLTVLASVSQGNAATTLIKFGFNAAGGGDNISETTGWDGTGVAAGGSLDTNVSLTSGLIVAGGYLGGNGSDVFHVDAWHSSDLAAAVTAGKNVSFTIAPQAGYQFQLGDGTGVLTTQLHSHAQTGDVTDVFDRVSLYIGGVFAGTQNYIHNDPAAPAVQLLTFNIGANPLLNGLTSATNVAFYFWDSTGGTYEPGLGDDQHGVQWDNADGAFIQFNGTVEIVPEPSRALLGFLALAFAFFRRRR